MMTASRLKLGAGDTADRRAEEEGSRICPETREEQARGAGEEAALGGVPEHALQSIDIILQVLGSKIIVKKILGSVCNEQTF